MPGTETCIVAKFQLAGRDVNPARERVKLAGVCSLSPDVNLIVTCGDVMQFDLAASRCHGKVGRSQSYNHCRHLGMDIAEKVRNALVVEADDPVASCLVQAEVKSFSIELRKDVVKEGIEIGEFDRAPQGHDQKVRIEALVLLLHAKVPGGNGVDGGIGEDRIRR